MTKRGSGANCFNNNELRKYYNDVQQCYVCDLYGASEFHHSEVRKRKYANSLLNAIPIHPACHVNHGFITRLDNQQMLFRKVVINLLRQGYKFTELDRNYINEYSDKFMPVLEDLNK